MAVSGLEWPGLARISGLLVDGLITLAIQFSVDFAAYQPLRSLSGLQLWSASIFEVYFFPTPPPPPSSPL